MSYFVFDQTASQAIRNHINGINLKKKSEEYYLNSNIALFLKDELKDINPFCQQLNFIGNYIYDLEKDVRKTSYYNYMDTTDDDVFSNIQTTVAFNNTLHWLTCFPFICDRFILHFLLQSRSKITIRNCR